MNTWQAFLLGLVQGFTEFLPVSSSGHLALGQYLLGFNELHHFLLFNIVCHLGTLFAILLIFLPQIKESLSIKSELFRNICLGTLPLFPLVFIIKPLKEILSKPEILGPCFIITSALLFISFYFRIPSQFSNTQKSWRDPLTIGCFQAIAIFPGISRSGATVSAARLLSWPKEKALQFSFILAIPAILGGTILESWQVIKAGSSIHTLEISWTIYAIGFLTSLISGYFALRLLIRMMIHDKWNYFAWYCLILGVMTTIYFNY
ncbi:MAG: undecaprenyl-diphosphate phosphatase [Parachlamydiaceae bacterium]|nr:undecaprenyl-diphosphate phosphatase [Parachlamydiaceae bacterium]